MRYFCFTVDDNIRCLKEITERRYGSIFDHPYLAMYERLHKRYGLKVQLNLFYETERFDLSRMSDCYRSEWERHSDWLKLSFHARKENERPYENAGYGEVFEDCGLVHREIDRFASPASRADTTTVHYCLATDEGLCALKAQGVLGLLGLYGTEGRPCTSYRVSASDGARIRNGDTVMCGGIAHAGIDLILNLHTKEEILDRLQSLLYREFVKVMIHEQYFYSDYPYYQPDFEEKLDAAFGCLTKNGFKSIFFEQSLRNSTACST